MRETTANESDMTVEELRAHVAQLRAAQGLPPTIENPTTLQHVADLMRTTDQQQRKRAS